MWKGHPNHPNCFQRIIESLLAPAFQHVYAVLCFGVGHGTWWPQGASFRVRRYFDVAKGNVVPLQAFHQASPLILWCFHQHKPLVFFNVGRGASHVEVMCFRTFPPFSLQRISSGFWGGFWRHTFSAQRRGPWQERWTLKWSSHLLKPPY